MKKINEDIKLYIYIIIALLAAFLPVHTITGNGIEWLWSYIIMILFLYNVVTIFVENRSITVDKSFLLLSSFTIYLIARGVIGGNEDYRSAAVLLFLLLYLNFRQKIKYNYIIPYLFIGIAVVESIWGVSQYIGVINNPLKNVIGGGFYGPIGFAACLVVTYPLCFILLKSKERSLKIIGVVSMLVILAGVIISESRAAVISVTLSSLIFAYSVIKINKTRYLFLFGTFVVSLFTALFFINIESIYGRLLIWRVSLNMIMDDFIFGKGVHGFSSEYMSYQADYFVENPDSIFYQLADNVTFTFNEYINLFINYGVVGFVLLLIILGYFLINNSKSNPYLLSLISIMIFGFFSYPTHYPFVIIVLAYVVSQLPNNSRGAVKEKIYNIFSSRDSKYKWKSVSVIIIMVILLYVSFIVAKKMEGMRRWDRTISQSYFELTPEVMQQYDSLYISLGKDHNFLYNYGTQLSRNGEYEMSLKIMQECNQWINDYNINIHLGDNYLNTKQYRLAKEHYQSASNMIPNRFIPLDCLLFTYDLCGDKKEAVKMAKQIIAKEVKVPSFETTAIIKRANNYITSGKYNY